MVQLIESSQKRHVAQLLEPGRANEQMNLSFEKNLNFKHSESGVTMCPVVPGKEICDCSDHTWLTVPCAAGGITVTPKNHAAQPDWSKFVKV